MIPARILPYSFCSWCWVRLSTLQHGMDADRVMAYLYPTIRARVTESKEFTGSLTIDFRPKGSCDGALTLPAIPL